MSREHLSDVDDDLPPTRRAFPRPVEWRRGLRAAGPLAAVSTFLLIFSGGCGDDDAKPGGGDPAGGGGQGGAAAGGGGAGGGGAGGEGGTGPTFVLPKASKSSTVAVSPDDSLVAMVNPEHGSVSFFDVTSETRISLVEVGSEPSSIVIHPDGQTAFVSNRADATVMRIDGIGTDAPTVSAPTQVGSEPTGIALSPTGATLYVAEHAEGRVSAIDTATMEIASSTPVKNPYALTVTNDLDEDDSDEVVIAPEFFGEPTAEADNTGRTGRIRVLDATTLAPAAPISLAPIDSGFAPEVGEPTVMSAPNQLSSVTVQAGKVYVTTTSVSPEAPVKFNSNIQPIVYSADLDSGQQNADTANLARLVKDAAGDDPIRFLADIVDIAFIGESNVAYVVSRGSDTVQRVVYEAAGIEVGSDFNLQIETLNGCKNPTGIATAHEAARAYVNCWLDESLGVLDLSTQSLATTISSAPQVDEEAVAKGKRFFFTGRGRWSDNGWSSCSSCHPGGLTDNVTWSFAAGPRQSTSLDGSFSHGPGAQKQRIFNWSGIFDEVHDFERNTRGVSGGLGAVTQSPSGNCGDLAQEVQEPAALPGNLAQPIKELQDAPENCTKDWDDVEAYMRTIRPPSGLVFLDEDSVERGAALFGAPTANANNGGCVSCHGGSGWTASRRFFAPSSATNTALAGAAFVAPEAWPASWNFHSLQIAAQPPEADGDVAQGPPQVACVLRNVNTFGIPGDPSSTDLLEVRDSGNRAQGAGGFNIPSLYGMSVGAPYLHHGQAASLQELFDDPAWEDHLRAANQVFLTTGDVAQQKQDLINFILSIDASTAEQSLPAGLDGCPSAF